MEVLARRIDRSEKLAKGDRKYLAEVDLFRRLMAHLESEQPARTFDCTDEERELVRSVALISAKPVIYAANLDENGFADYETTRSTRKSARSRGGRRARPAHLRKTRAGDRPAGRRRNAACSWKSSASVRAVCRA